MMVLMAKSGGGGGGGVRTINRLEYHKISKNWDIQITVIVLKMEKSFDFTMS